MSIFKTAMTTTALASMLVAAAPKAYAMDLSDNAGSSALPKAQILPTIFEQVKFELQPTGLAQKVEKNLDGTIKVTTNNNDNADYQLESNRFPVTPGRTIKVLYDIKVEENGIMSLGLLNTARNNWYGEELILKAGDHQGFYNQIIPEGEVVTSLVFRNYHLISNGGAGQSTFTINGTDIQQEVIQTPGAVSTNANSTSAVSVLELPDVEEELDIRIRAQHSRKEEIVRASTRVRSSAHSIHSYIQILSEKIPLLNLESTQIEKAEKLKSKISSLTTEGREILALVEAFDSEITRGGYRATQKNIDKYNTLYYKGEGSIRGAQEIHLKLDKLHEKIKTFLFGDFFTR